MSKTLIVLISAAVLAVVAGISGVSMYFSYNRQEVQARNACQAQLGNLENVLDNMWKNFQEIGGIRADTCAAHPLVRNLHLAEVRPERLA